MYLLNGIKNFLSFVNDNWTAIAVVMGLSLAVARKAMGYFQKSDGEKIAIAKRQLQETILKLVADAEQDYGDWKQAGSVKRAQVIDTLFADYPILSKLSDQEAFLQWIDGIIDESLVTLREIITRSRH